MRSLKRAAALLLTLAMLVGMVAVPAAAAEEVAISTTMEQVEGDIYKLTFHVTSSGLNTANVVLSYDNKAIVPVDVENGYSEVEVTDGDTFTNFMFSDIIKDRARKNYSQLISWVVDGDRTAFETAVLPSNPAAKVVDELDGATLFSFYFKLNSELAKGSFKIETDKSEGSILSRLYKTPEALANASGALVSDKDGVNYTYCKDDADTLNIDLTYIGSDKQSLDSVTLSADPTAVVVNGKDDQTVTLKPAAVDVDGEPYPTDAVTYDFKDGGTGATRSGNTITVPAMAEEGTITVTAQLAGKTSNEVTIKVTREAPVASKVEVSGAESIAVPASGSVEEKYTAVVTDQYGSAMTGEKVVWSIEPADAAGITMADGTLTVTSEAAAAGAVTVKVKATAGSVSGEASVSVAREAPKPASVSVTVPEATVTAPALNAEAVSVQASAKVLDQYGGEVKDAEVKWELTAAPEGVTIDADGKITVAPAATAGEVTVKATSGELSGTAKFNVVRAQSAAASVELYRDGAKVGADDTLIIPVEGKNEYAYTTKVLDQYGAEMKDVAIDWAFATADEKVTFANGTVTVNAGAVKDTKYTLTATVNGTEVKASTAITVKDIEITWPTVTVKENPVYGDTWGQIVTISGGSASINGQPVEGTFSVKNADARPDAGKSSYVLNFTSADKAYNVDYTGAEVTVAPKAITITGVTATDRAYDTTTTVAITGGTLVGVLDGDEVKATVPATGTVASANAGSNLAVTLGEITLDNANYTLTQPTGITVNITKAEITELDVTSVADVTVLTSDVDSIDAVKGKISVTEATATFGDGLTEKVTITWTTGDSFAPGTDKTYTFTGTVGTDNLDGSKLTALTAKVIVTEKHPVDVTVTAPADVTYGTAVGDPAAEQADKGYGVEPNPDWKFEYEGTGDTTYARSETKPTQAGTYVVYATLVSEKYAGSGVSASFKINPKDIASATVTLPEDFSATYTGKAFEPDVIVKDGETTLVKDTDYTLSYANNINAGTATVTVTGKGNYTGTNSTCTFEIAKASLAEKIPTIVGTAQVGGVLTAKLDGVAADQYTWTWYRDGAAIDGATAASYVVTSANSNKAITVKATALDKNYTGETETSEAVTVAKQAITGTVTITANAATIADGTVLTANASVEPAGVNYQWSVDGQAVEGETNATFTVPADSANKSITVTVTPDSEDYTGSIVSAPVVVGKTVLTGTVTLAQADGKITATVADAAEDSYDIVWLRDGQVISGATGVEYTVADADKGHTITAKLVAKGDYTGEILSDAISVAATVPAAPSVSASTGDSQVTVSWTVSDNGGKPVTNYTVQCNDEAVITLDAATTSYTFTGLTNGTKYTFKVVASNSEGNSAAATVEATPNAPSGGGGGGGGVTTYTVTVEKADNGTVTVSPKSAAKDATVTITIAADKGYALNTLTVTDKDGKEIELTKVNDTKYTFKMPASKVTVKADFVKTSTLPFTDVAADAWYYDAVAYVYEQGMMKGTNDGTTFSPAMNLTRGMMAQILYNLEKGTAPAEGSFTDVAADAWYADAVNWAAANDIVNGYGNGKFGPEDSITREQMAVLLYNYAKFKGYDVTTSGDLTTFSDDEKVSDWAEYAMKWAVGEKLINGSNNALNPLGTASRAEVAQILMNFGQNVAK